MDTDYSTPFSKAILTGVFAGIVTTILCLAYNMIFRESTDFSMSEIINVSTLIFFTNILFLIIGIIYYGFLQVKRGELIFSVLFLLLTAVLAFMASNAHRSEVPLLNLEFHQLLVPLVIIMGLVASLGMPFLFHSKKFEEHVL